MKSAAWLGEVSLRLFEGFKNLETLVFSHFLKSGVFWVF